jgi:uncharacterized protein with FMN-binding domain
MRKTLVIIFAVAVLGGLSFYVNKSQASDHASSAVSSNAPAVNPSSSSSNSNTSSSTSGTYKDGTFSGNAAETPYGTVQVAAVISGGKITDVEFLQMPTDEQHSREVTAMSKPLLKESALSKQSAHGLDMVSGATSTYYGYQESLQAALNKAKLS